MPSYKLYYFDIRGRAEIMRLMFALTGTKYEDVRIKQEQWAEFRAKTPFGQMPVLEIDGKKYGQSGAISAYLIEVLNAGGKTPVERLQCGQILGLVADIFSAFGSAHFEQDAAKKKEMEDKLHKETVPKTLAIMEKLLTENKTGYFVGNAVTAADLAVYDLLDTLLNVNSDLLKACKATKVEENRKKVAANKNIDAYLKKRTPSPL